MEKLPCAVSDFLGLCKRLVCITKRVETRKRMIFDMICKTHSFASYTQVFVSSEAPYRFFVVSSLQTVASWLCTPLPLEGSAVSRTMKYFSCDCNGSERQLTKTI